MSRVAPWMPPNVPSVVDQPIARTSTGIRRPSLPRSARMAWAGVDGRASSAVQRSVGGRPGRLGSTRTENCLADELVAAGEPGHRLDRRRQEREAAVAVGREHDVRGSSRRGTGSATPNRAGRVPGARARRCRAPRRGCPANSPSTRTPTELTSNGIWRPSAWMRFIRVVELEVRVVPHHREQLPLGLGPVVVDDRAVNGTPIRSVGFAPEGAADRLGDVR